ncbi:hypothetical protein CK203_077536 [Vitis vinifera]|uniref:Uncharacterized protein n=1 Tax=Vitis vinifera TaxID=29760 RepID=A0A438DTH9_VITVI|nr:hypothetical protein CK203_077536 [Vitis vinifera]
MLRHPGWDNCHRRSLHRAKPSPDSLDSPLPSSLPRHCKLASLFAAVNHSDRRYERCEEEVQEMQSPMTVSSGKRKKSTVDKYFVPRNTQEAQPSMRSVLARKEAIWRTYMAVGRLFYDACIPTNAVNSFYFRPMLDAISAIAHCLNLIFKDIGKMDHVAELVRSASKENFCNKTIVIGGVMDVIDQKVLKGKLNIMNEMKLFRDRLGSFRRDLAYSSREVLQLVELDVEELENLLYEEGSIPINEVEGSSSHIDDEDGGGVTIEGLDVEKFGFPNAHFQSPYPNFQNE